MSSALSSALISMGIETLLGMEIRVYHLWSSLYYIHAIIAQTAPLASLRRKFQTSTSTVPGHSRPRGALFQAINQVIYSSR